MMHTIVVLFLCTICSGAPVVNENRSDDSGSELFSGFGSDMFSGFGSEMFSGSGSEMFGSGNAGKIGLIDIDFKLNF